MYTFRKQERSVLLQKTAPFTGEGAYHGSTQRRPTTQQQAPIPVAREMFPTTLEQYHTEGKHEIDIFEAVFPNRYTIESSLPVPSQEEIMNDGVTFCWCPLQQAIQEAGPLTKRVLEAMSGHVEGKKKYVYIDSKIQYFEPGDVPVDSQHWHVDGSITARDQRVQALGYTLLHDMKARLQSAIPPPTYLSYQSSAHCATLFATTPLSLALPELIPHFDELDRLVREAEPPCEAQPASSIVRFDGLSLHRAVAATESGWRLWVRCIETDRQVQLNTSIIDCYGTVFRTS